ncbi:quinoprotein relay system zinc metallohydrolase 2 [Roseomonas marmotae]|uniref:Quinoprotein relay system zinc metallohydrolase 2 n=1 Tax=Roseomonas marmotae TaxID=2768161 RepID=A0ABS3KDJ2_9PROT|nr:quinoprotein relay system zinc metallohydrolase 2 [Roseomonas marmotae]MBO1075541.1 quinoprotein relay system zinc metallohydrolase 2 [Roseomonas marmotae]QTI81532.1 quinoprotein relay system zinc metallohydrolase 2 [Roseomonas marmotae]
MLLGLAAQALPIRPAAAGPAPGPDDCVEVAPGLWVMPGRMEEASPGNLNTIANTGFICGAKATAVIDPGGSLAHGQLLRQAIEARGAPPVRHLVLTHVHPDHIMGAEAFADLAPEVIGHARLPESLSQRGAYYTAMLEREMGSGAAGSGVLVPTRLVEDHVELDLGGRRLELCAHPPAHTDHDLSLRDDATGTLWLSDLLFVDRIPALDGDLLGWLRVLDALREEAAPLAVPGHGPPAVPWPQAAAPLHGYLTALRDGVRGAIAAGTGLAEAPERVAVEAARHWQLADRYHGRNVTAAYRQLEWE